jgi:hypothetical protein
MNDPQDDEDLEKFEINRLDSFSPQLDKLNVGYEETKDIVGRVSFKDD